MVAIITAEMKKDSSMNLKMMQILLQLIIISGYQEAKIGMILILLRLQRIQKKNSVILDMDYKVSNRLLIILL